MAKIGVSFRIDVLKLDKARFYVGAKGTYLDVTGFIDLDEKDQYGNNGFITQDCSKEERAQGLKMPILGNSKIFFTDAQQAPMGHHTPPMAAPQRPAPQMAPQAPQQQAPHVMPLTPQQLAVQQAQAQQQAPQPQTDCQNQNQDIDNSGIPF